MISLCRIALPILAGFTLMGLESEALAQTRLLRMPDIHENAIVFCHGGDLWKVSTQGGLATRLTAHEGEEIFPRFSPDGKTIAFTGQYDGDEQVYVMPADGGVPRQLTYYPAQGPLPARRGYDNIVYGWSPDGRSILFRSLMPNLQEHKGKLYTVPLEGGLPAPLPMPQSGAGDFSPDGRKVAYSPLFRDFRTWNRYEGGWAQELFIFDLASRQVTPIAPSARTERDPMWIGDRIFFTSDRDDYLNLYAFNVNTQKLEEITHYVGGDVRWPSADASGQIVYEYLGDLHVLDTRSSKERVIAVEVPSDETAKRPSRINVKDDLEDAALSPDGKRAVVVARGDVFTVPAEKGPTRSLTQSSNAHDKAARWSPDGKLIAYISDRSGEEELYLVAQDGSSPARQITKDGKAFRYPPAWSPTGNHLAFSDKDGKVYVLEIASQRLDLVADADYQPFEPVTDYTFSPDGGHLAFTLVEPTGISVLYLYSLSEKKLRKITSSDFDVNEPAWDPKGNYLYFLTRRTFSPQISEVEWNFAVNRATNIVALALRKDVPHPFPPESDEVGQTDEASGDKAKPATNDPQKPAEKKGDKKGDKQASSPTPLKIDFEGLEARAAMVPVPPHNYSQLVATDEGLLYLRSLEVYYGRKRGANASLVFFGFKDRKENELASQLDGYEVSYDGKVALLQREKGIELIQVKAEKPEAKALSLDELYVNRIPAEEWEEIFMEVWRRYRDFFYVENMHGYDWVALREQYRPLLKHVGHRSDLNYLIGQMISELNVGHAYIEGGDMAHPERVAVGLPGALFALDAASGRYRIDHIFKGQNEEPRYRSPLTEIGVNISEGDYVLAIDGIALEAPDNPYRLLRGKTDHPVTFTVNSRPSLEGARQVTFNPIKSEDALAYLNWIETRRAMADKLSSGQIGYVHVPDMGGDGISEFIKWYYPQIRKSGLIIDVRDNGGGNVSPWIIERLDREMLAIRLARTLKGSQTQPRQVFVGHMAALLNETTCSDGDIFSYTFKQSNLGPLIGKRSWGGVVGITDHGPLLDGGRVSVPQGGMGSVRGEWIVEGIGVPPDIEVENDPASVAAGKDLQLERAVKELLSAMEKEPRTIPPRPADPVKTPKARR